MSARNPSGVGSLSLKVRIEIGAGDTMLEVIHTRRTFKASGWTKSTSKL